MAAIDAKAEASEPSISFIGTWVLRVIKTPWVIATGLIS
jgi:hypothetical protein